MKLSTYKRKSMNLSICGFYHQESKKTRAKIDCKEICFVCNKTMEYKIVKILNFVKFNFSNINNNRNTI